MLHQLNLLHGKPGLTFDHGNGGLLRAVVNTPAAQGEMYLQGAHVTAWRPSGHEPVLWLSQSSHFEKGKPIRGGVPICFPWFGPNSQDPTAPAHGFARLSEWQVVSTHADGEGTIELHLETSIGPFLMHFEAAFGRNLRMILETKLSANASSQASFEDALHTYFAVSDVRAISIGGLETTSFIDKVEQAKSKPPSGSPIRFMGETDRVYVDTISNCLLVDEGMARTIRIAKSGSASTVVWNPWIDKSKRMVDFGDEEWPRMVCIETANVGANRVSLEPGESHSTSTLLSFGN